MCVLLLPVAVVCTATAACCPLPVYIIYARPGVLGASAGHTAGLAARVSALIPRMASGGPFGEPVGLSARVPALIPRKAAMRDAHSCTCTYPQAAAYNGISMYISEWHTQQADQRGVYQAHSAHVHIPGRPT